MIWNDGFRRVHVNSDCLEAVTLINSDCNDNNPWLSLVLHCKLLLKRSWVYMLNHVFRESNCVADCLAREGQFLGRATVFLLFLPSRALLALTRDAYVAPTARTGNSAGQEVLG
ncbi:hypothetical protein ACOSQ2_007058 [Xanthoceras sorbifolium]